MQIRRLYYYSRTKKMSTADLHSCSGGSRSISVSGGAVALSHAIGLFKRNKKSRFHKETGIKGRSVKAETGQPFS